MPPATPAGPGSTGRCHGCLCLLDGVQPDMPQICTVCWESLSPAERAHYMQTRALTRAVEDAGAAFDSLLGEARRQADEDGGSGGYPSWLGRN